jgi:bacterioferritin
MSARLGYDRDHRVLVKQWRKESIEEMQHADNLIVRIIFLDGSPNMQTLESLHIGKTVKEVLDRDLEAEMEAHALYVNQIRIHIGRRAKT